MRVLTVTVQHESEIVLARQRARQLAELLGFEVRDQTRIAAAVSEIVRNAYTYAGGGKVEFEVEGKTAPQVLLVKVSDKGPGIAELKSILDGTYQAKDGGAGLGILSARRVMDQFDIASVPGQGATVSLKKLFSVKMPLVTPQRLAQVCDELARKRLADPLDEIQQQNQELLLVLEELRTRQEELLQLNRELEDTNRGVVALYAELDEKADHLRRADDLKTRFLSNMSHEFRTPINSILALSRLLLDRTDGKLTEEQEKQVGFIRKAADALLELINDLLDIAKIEAGKTTVQPRAFAVDEFFSTLRGMLRPLFINDSVQLIFDQPQDLPLLYTDESKVSQILRNFLSNALKFTERGEVRVSAKLSPTEDHVIFSVHDTGIGIAPEDQETIFQEFTQLENPLQKRVKGTGLGLPLCKKLAQLLGGSVSVQSTLGVGSTFSTVIPLHHFVPPPADENGVSWESDPSQVPVLVIEDEPEAQLIYKKYLRGSRFQVIPARSLREARLALLQVHPRVIILDILLPGEDSWSFLAEMKAGDETRDIPILVVSTVEDERKGFALGADGYGLKPVTSEWLLTNLTRLTDQPPSSRVLIVDDEEISRYVLRQFLAEAPYTLSEATTGWEGLHRARNERPQVIFLDLNMPGMDGYALLEQLKADPMTSSIPVVIITSRVLSQEERLWLSTCTASILSKTDLSREAIITTIETALGYEDNRPSSN